MIVKTRVILQATVHSTECRGRVPMLRRDPAQRNRHQVCVVYDPNAESHSDDVIRAVRAAQSAQRNEVRRAKMSIKSFSAVHFFDMKMF